MSAVIKIETEDKALAGLLTVVIANAIVDAGFTNTAAKLITINSQVQRGNGFDLVTQLDALPKEVTLNPPELRDIMVMLAPSSFIDDCFQTNPEMMSKPVILDGFKDSCEKYEQEAAAFLGK